MIVPPYKIQLELQQQFSSSHSSSSSSFSNNQQSNNQEKGRSWMTKRDLIEFVINCGVIESGRSSHGQFTINSASSHNPSSHHLPSSQSHSKNNQKIDNSYYYPVLIDGEYIGVGTFQILKFVEKQLRFLKVWSLNEMGKIPEISISSSNHKMREEQEDEEEEMIKLLSPTTEIALIPPIIIKEEEEKEKDENQNLINSPSKKQQGQDEEEDQDENDQNDKDENEIQFGVGTYPGLFIFFTSGNRFMRPVINLEINQTTSQNNQENEEEEDQIFNSFNNSEYIGSLSQVFLEIACLENELKTNEKEDQQNQSSSSSSHLTSHLELDSTNMLSIIASFTPFSDFNQSPRNMYQVFVLKRDRLRMKDVDI